MFMIYCYTYDVGVALNLGQRVKIKLESGSVGIAFMPPRCMGVRSRALPQ